MPKWFRVDVSVMIDDSNTEESAEECVRRALQRSPATFGVAVHEVEEETD